MQDLLVFQVNQLLKFNDIRLDRKELDFQIKSHPSYPSLHAVTGVLDHFNISNIALDVPKTEAVLSQLPERFLAQVITENGEEFAVVKNKGLVYDIYMSPKKKSKLTIAEFLEKFTGIIVAVENDDSTLLDKKTDTTLIKNSLLISCALLFFAHLIFINTNLYTAVFFSLSVIGIFVSASIFKQELGEASLLGNAFCSSTNEKKSCDAVLSSKGANIFGNLKLSDLSIIYFSGLALATYILSLMQENISHLYVVSALAIPVTIYSIYYQYAVIKKWCLLCLSIVVILWLQSAVAVLNIDIITAFSFKNVFIIGFAVSSPLALWYFISPLIKNEKTSKKTKIDFVKFKRNFNLFNTLLETSNPIDTKVSNSFEIILGNVKSPLNITLITNPFCGHCKAVHTLVENIITTYNDKVSITIRINVDTKDETNALFKITTRLLEIYHTQGQAACIKAMHDIYGELNTEAWFAKWGTCETPLIYIKTLDAQSNWANKHHINFTPELLINGRSYPKEYDRQDLIYFIEELEEHYTLKEETTNIPILQ